MLPAWLQNLYRLQSMAIHRMGFRASWQSDRRDWRQEHNGSRFHLCQLPWRLVEHLLMDGVVPQSAVYETGV